LSYILSFTIAFAPVNGSSAGCASITSVPFHSFFNAFIIFATCSSHVTCASCPQACITGTSVPSSFFIVLVLA
jgi:hypothetical protein